MCDKKTRLQICRILQYTAEQHKFISLQYPKVDLKRVTSICGIERQIADNTGRVLILEFIKGKPVYRIIPWRKK